MGLATPGGGGCRRGDLRCEVIDDSFQDTSGRGGVTVSVRRNGADGPVGGHGGRTAPPGGREGSPALTMGGKCARGSGRRGEAPGDRIWKGCFIRAFGARRGVARSGSKHSPYDNPPHMTLGRVHTKHAAVCTCSGSMLWPPQDVSWGMCRSGSGIGIINEFNKL